jgi:NAD-dependent dihydropyrimidine dehydrogenase PreA subunit
MSSTIEVKTPTRTAPAKPAGNGTATDTSIAYINGKATPITEGETILDLLRRNMGPDPVPTLCDAPNLEPFGSCRVCSVEVALKEDGPTKVMASCHTPVANGQYITTHSERMKRLRKNIVELVLTNYPTEQLKTEDHGANELYNVVQKIGFDIDSVRYPKGALPLDAAGADRAFISDTTHPYMVSNLDSCINCYRCVRACDEVQGEMVLTMAGRGFDSWIAKGTGDQFQGQRLRELRRLCAGLSDECHHRCVQEQRDPGRRGGAQRMHVLRRWLQLGSEGEGQEGGRDHGAVRCRIQPRPHLPQRPLRLPLL